MTDTSRRNFLKKSGLIAATGLILPKSIGILSAKNEKKLVMHNAHTGEWLNETISANGEFNPDALKQANHFFRDWRRGTVHEVDPKLLDLLHDITMRTSNAKPIELYSGYRDPRTNRSLKGTAKRSFHMKGMAADIKIPGVALSNIRKAACALDAGGVGQYSTFVHVDVRPGRKARWGRR